MKILFLADIVGKPGRVMVEHHLLKLKKLHDIDFVIANIENASHGYGINIKNSQELFKVGIDVMTGGNHSWDKKEIASIMDTNPILRPINLPDNAPGKGLYIADVNGEKIAVINLMGYYTMPMVDNPFIKIKKVVDELIQDGYKNIFIDIHAEATAEKRVIFMMLKGKVSAICGSHTHIGTDDLEINNGTFYVTDVGLTGCCDGVLGMHEQEPIQKSLTSFASKFDIPKQCKKLLQGVVFELKEGKCVDAYKIKAYDFDEAEVTQHARFE